MIARSTSQIWSIPLPKVEWATVKTVTSLLTFFVVFYGGQCFTRFQMFFGHCIGVGGVCMNWAALVRNYYPPDADARWNAVRLILASMHILYYSLNADTSGGSDVNTSEWNRIRYAKPV